MVQGAIAEPPKEAGQQTLIRVLIVEDESVRNDYYHYIRKFEENELPVDRGVIFEVEPVGNAAKAKELLKRAAEDAQPFDLMFLDLSIPERDERGSAKFDYGFAVATFAVQERSAKCIVLLSGDRNKLSQARESLGANDVITELKGDRKSQEEILRKHIQNVVRPFTEDQSWKVGRPVDSTGIESARLFAQRLQELVPFAERCIVDSFGLCFSRCLRDVERSRETIGTELLERLGLDLEHDSGDRLVQPLLEIDRSLETARHDWSELQRSLGLNFAASPHRLEIRGIVNGLLQEFEPCMTHKGAIVSDSAVEDATVISFGDEVRAILSEMTVGALAEYRDSREGPLVLSSQYTDARGEQNSDGDWVEITLKDYLTSLEPGDVNAINDGVGAVAGDHFSRAWGLIVMQHIALQGGGRLKVDTSGGGNKIMYRIPRAPNA